jgi:hypothetical protein
LKPSHLTIAVLACVLGCSPANNTRPGSRGSVEVDSGAGGSAGVVARTSEGAFGADARGGGITDGIASTGVDAAAGDTARSDMRANESSDGAPKMDAAGQAAQSDGGAATLRPLDGLRIELPCIPKFYEAKACLTTAATAKQRYAITFGGVRGTIYEVTLRVRGLVELAPYPGGTAIGNFVEGGAPEPGTHLLVLQLSVASPKRDYFFNKGTYNGDELYKLDYTASIKVEGGSTMTFIASDENMDQAKNYKNIVVDGILPAPLPFDGEFVQFNVGSVNPPH